MADVRPELDRSAVIVLNWNKPEMTIECVEALMTMEGDYDIYVIDNGSDGDARDSLAGEMKARGACILTEDELDGWDPRPNIPRLTLILLKRNYGYAKGNNFGLRLAYRLGYKYSLISNNDIKIIDRDVLVKLIDAIERDSKYAWAGPRVLGPDGKEQGPYPVMSFWEYALGYGILYPLFYLVNKLRRSWTRQRKPWLAIPSGAFFLVRTQCVASVGFFDEKTFLYAEEPILQAKFAARGYLLAYEPTVRVLHLTRASSRDLASEKKLFAYNLAADLYYYRKYRGYSRTACAIGALSRWVWFYTYYAFIRALRWSPYR